MIRQGLFLLVGCIYAPCKAWRGVVNAQGMLRSACGDSLDDFMKERLS